MSILRCKMCGGTVEFEPGATVGVCDSCGTKQTLPRIDSDRRANLYDRADHYRRSNDYDKAMIVYEQILGEDPMDAEAHWSVVLCRYGIEYVEDPISHKRIPTVNRTQFTSIFDDEDYQATLRYADDYQREIYVDEARAIDGIQKDILDISKKEDPFDVFICYKETGTDGRRTQDSVIAYDLYQQLTREDLKVFFSRVTLEDKLGTAYEPYIFAALNSAKVMVVLGTKREYFNAVWVRNEWSRFLGLIRADSTKVLIPAYRDMDPYDLPDEFSHLQAQDMSKLGFMQDLVRGILKICENKKVRQEPARNDVAPLFKRITMFLEDEDWESVDEYANRVLDQEPENTQGYLYKVLAKYQVKDYKALIQSEADLDNDIDFEKACRFADQKTADQLERLKTAAREYRISSMMERAEEFEKEDTIEGLREAKNLYLQLPDHEKAREKALACEKRLRALEKKSLSNKKKKRFAIVFSICLVLMLGLGTGGYFLYQNVLLPKQTYEKAMELQENGNYDAAIQMFRGLGTYENSAEQMKILQYKKAQEMIDECNYDAAIEYMDSLTEFNYDELDSKIEETRFQKAQAMTDTGAYDDAIDYLESLREYGYEEIDDRIVEVSYQKVQMMLDNGQYADAIDYLQTLKERGFPDVDEQISKTKYAKAISCDLNTNVMYYRNQNYITAYGIFLELGDYQDSSEKLRQIKDAWLKDTEVSDDCLFGYFSTIQLQDSSEYSIYYSTAIRLLSEALTKHVELNDGGVKDYYIYLNSYNVGQEKYVNYMKFAIDILKQLPGNYEYTNELLLFSRAVYAKGTWDSNREQLIDNFLNDKKAAKVLYENFEFAKDIFDLKYFGYVFYLGKWITADGKFNIEWYENKEENGIWCTYNVPFSTASQKMKWWNLWGYTFVACDEDNKLIDKMYELEFRDYDTLQLYCYKDGKTYTMYRN